MRETRIINEIEYSIRRCPFCGTTNHIEITSPEAFSELYSLNGSATISIRCKKCYAELYEHSYTGNNYNKKLNILITKWNTRSDND